MKEETNLHFLVKVTFITDMWFFGYKQIKFLVATFENIETLK